MLAIRIKMTWDPPVLSRRKLTAALKVAFETAGSYWKEQYLPRHFDQRQGRYQYRRRTQKYLTSKAKKAKLAAVQPPVVKGGALLLVNTGLTERSMEAHHPVRAYPTRVTIKMPGPRYVGMRPYKSNHPNLGAEITKVTADENRTLLALFERTLQKEIDAYREKRVSQ